MVQRSHKFVLLLILILSLTVSSVLAQQNDCVYYFYGDECDQCAEANSYIDGLQQSYPDLNIQKFEVHYNRENAKMLEQVFVNYAVPEDSQGIPLAVVAGTYYVGPTAISTLLEGRIKENNDNTCPDIEDEVWFGVIGDKTTGNALKLLSTPRLIGKALAKAFTLQMVVVWLLLLIFLVSIHGKKTIRKHGLLFVGGVYLSLLLFNLGVLPALGTVTTVFYKSVALLVLTYGVVGGVKFFNPGAFKFSEKNMKKILHLKKEIMSTFGMFVIGFIVTYLSNAQASSITALLRLLTPEFPLAVFSKVIYYALIVSLPPAILIFVVDKIKDRLERHASNKGGPSESKVKKWQEYNHKIFHLVICGISALAGFVLLFV